MEYNHDNPSKAFYSKTKSELTKLKNENDAPNAEMDADLLLICDP
jgi:hypothetical protein